LGEKADLYLSTTFVQAVVEREKDASEAPLLQTEQSQFL